MGGGKICWQARLAGRPDLLGQMRECTGQRAPAQSREAWAIGIVGMGGWESGIGLILPPPEHGEEEPGWALCQNGHSQILRLHVIYYNELHSMT